MIYIFVFLEINGLVDHTENTQYYPPDTDLGDTYHNWNTEGTLAKSVVGYDKLHYTLVYCYWSYSAHCRLNWFCLIPRLPKLDPELAPGLLGLLLEEDPDPDEEVDLLDGPWLGPPN